VKEHIEKQGVLCRKKSHAQKVNNIRSDLFRDKKKHKEMSTVTNGEGDEKRPEEKKGVQPGRNMRRLGRSPKGKRQKRHSLLEKSTKKRRGGRER